MFRTLCVFFGGSLLAHRLASGISPADGEAAPGPYLDWLGDALTPTTNTVGALGNTMFLASSAILVGSVVGLILAGLLRIRFVGNVFGALPVPLMALAVPGLVLFPLADAAVDGGLIPDQAFSDGQSLADNLRFIGFWGLVAGLAIAPAVAAVTAGSGRHRYLGLSVGEAPLAARTGPSSGWRIGLPTTALGLSVASAEILSSHPGLFDRFAGALEVGRPTIALDTALIVIAAAAVLALVVDIVAAISNQGRNGTDPEPDRLAQVAPSRALVPLFGLLVLATGFAGAGFSLDSVADADQTNSLAAPSFGGPWLGTDGLGRSVMGLVAESMGPAMVAALVPATVAVVLGLVAATIRRASPPVIDRTLGALIDALWWPLPIMVPLAGRFWGPLDQPEFHIGLLGLTGLMLAPLATRLMTRSVVPAHSMRSLRVVAVLLFTAAVSLAVYLLADYMGSYGTDGRIGMGRLLFDGVQDYEQATWALVGPSLAAAGLLFMFLAFSASVASPTGVLEDDWDRMSSGDRTSILEGLDELADHEEPAPMVRLETEDFDETRPLDVELEHDLAQGEPIPADEPDRDPGFAPGQVPLLAEDVDDGPAGATADELTKPIETAPPMPDAEPIADTPPMPDAKPIADAPPMPDAKPIADAPPMPGRDKTTPSGPIETAPPMPDTEPIADAPPMPGRDKTTPSGPIETAPPMPDPSLATAIVTPLASPPMPGSDFSLSTKTGTTGDDDDGELTEEDSADDRLIDLRDSTDANTAVEAAEQIDDADDAEADDVDVDVDADVDVDDAGGDGAEVMASRTIELRPSTLRRAQARARQRAKAAGRPILAARNRRGQDTSDDN